VEGLAVAAGDVLVHGMFTLTLKRDKVRVNMPWCCGSQLYVMLRAVVRTFFWKLSSSTSLKPPASTTT